MIFLPTIIAVIILTIVLVSRNETNDLFLNIFVYVLISLFVTLGLYGLFMDTKVNTKEVWSGKIISVNHIEEYNERVTTTHTDSKGKKYTTSRTVHHCAENYIETTDGGEIKVSRSLDGKTRFNDKFPNTDAELEKFYPVNAPTASIHTYQNKVKSSYSIYKHKNINLKEYKDLPKYPKSIKNYIQIDRFLGDINNKDKVIQKLNEVNSDLNTKEKNKQVNLLFVNLKDKPEDYGFALHDYWEGGNKNDFVVCFSSSGNKINWVYTFSWADSEKSEKLKLDVREYMLKTSLNSDFTKVIDDIGKMIEENFERKEFADFNYLNVKTPTWLYIIVILVNIFFIYSLCFADNKSNKHKAHKKKRDKCKLTNVDETNNICKPSKTNEADNICTLDTTNKDYTNYKTSSVNEVTKKKKKRKTKNLTH
ncbi:hypothetical protein [Clostridium lundense]|uniref:hypothetical protein n=1 Tax=Clostridium lundense TaxID=319475 RepID=UPI000688A217|nr:hypothetical protein [Clostridium lundense]